MRDLAAGRWIVKTFGIVGGVEFDRWREILCEEYEIQVEIVAGSCVTIDEMEYVEGYNETARKHYDELFGVGVLERTNDRAVAETEAWVAQELPRVLRERSVEREAQVDRFGWIRCPHCSIKFSLADPRRWDGERHHSCFGRVRPVGATPGGSP
jgi:hypothetical protein